MVKHLREKLKTHSESQKGTRADAIIQIHPPPTHPPQTTFQTNCIVSMSQNSDCYDTPICQDTPVRQETTIFQYTPVCEDSSVCQDTKVCQETQD